MVHHPKGWRLALIALVAGLRLDAGELTVTEAITVAGERTTGFSGSFHCDDQANVFYLPAGYAQAPDTVIRVSADGKKVMRFSVRAVPGLGSRSGAGIASMALSPDGDLYVLAGSRHEGLSVVGFDKNGGYKSKLPLGERQITQFSVFESGKFLLSGFVGHGPWVGILSTGGEEMKIELHEDPALSKNQAIESRRQMVDLTLATSGGDGNVYVARAAPKGPVFAVSVSGEVTQRIQLVPPSPDTMVLSIKVSGGRLAAEHIGSTSGKDNTPRSVSIYDLVSGERIAVYPTVPGALVCYKSGQGMPDTFTFLGTPNLGQVRLLRASGTY